MIVRDNKSLKVRGHKRKLTTETIHLFVNETIKEDKALAEIVSKLEYYKGPFGYPKLLSDKWDRVSATLNNGGNEGLIIICSVCLTDGTQMYFSSLKILDEGYEAYKDMGSLSGAITFLGQEFLMLNQKAIKDQFESAMNAKLPFDEPFIRIRTKGICHKMRRIT